MRKLILVAIASMLPLISLADTATLSWVAPTEREDNTALPLSELGEFRIYWGLGTAFDNTTIVPDATATSYVINNLTPGTYSFRMTAVDVNGLESGFSETVSKTIQSTSPPLPPTITEVN